MTHEVHISRSGLTHPVKPEGVVLIDPDTGLPVPTLTQGLTDTQMRASPVPVSPNITRGGGPLDANTQRVTLATDGPGVASLSDINSKTPALLNGASPVTATARICLWAGTLNVATTVATLAALATAAGSTGGIPVGAVAVEFQPSGGSIRLSRFGAFTPTASAGYRVDDGQPMTVDSSLTDVKLIATASTTPVHCAFFDRV